MIDEARQAMDYLERVKGIERFSCVGMCAGAAAAGQISAADARVKKIMLINPLLPETNQVSVMRESGYYHKHALFSLSSWLRFFLMKSNYRYIWRSFKLSARRKIQPDFLGIQEDPSIRVGLKKFFRSLRSRGVQVFIVYSEGDIGDAYFRGVLGDEYRLMQDSGLLRTEILRGADHVVTPLKSQEELLNLISNWLTEKP
jgi:hypothetical protein